MKRFGVGLAMAMLCLGVAVLASGQVSRVHLGWSRNDVYTTMTVVWHAPVLEDQYVVYDLQSEEDVSDYEWKALGSGAVVRPTTGTNGQTISTTALPGYSYRVELVGLEPGTTYFFRVVDASGTATREWTLRTIALDQAIRFAFAGDSQRPYETPEGPGGQLLGNPTAPANWPFMRDFLTQKAAGESPDFFLALGDLVARGNNPEHWENWLDAWQANAVSPDGRMIPIVTVVGNHDLGGYPNIDSSYEWLLGQFAMPQPIPGLPCYALDFPELHLVVLAATAGHTSGTWAAATAEANAQLDWLEDDLAAAPDARWRLVAFHYNYLGCYCACTGYPSDVYTKAWSGALQDGGADMVFMGHTHNYTRSFPVTVDVDATCGPLGLRFSLQNDSENGITYITAGIWGGPTNAIVRGTSCDLWPWIAAAAGHPAMGLVELDGTALRCTVDDTSYGAPLDSFTLPCVLDTFGPAPYTETVR